eukprot:scaffold42081_cov72-Phaeocystis_antarctica.AAC.3
MQEDLRPVRCAAAVGAAALAAADRRHGKCKEKYSAEKKQQCKKTCDLCDALPPSAPPPSAPEDKCGGRTDTKKCKIKNCEMVKGKCKKQCKKCKKQCKKNTLKKKCQKTCCDLS